MKSSNCNVNPPAVDVRDLRKEFSRRDKKAGRFARKKRAALDGVTFTMERGECVAILGQNGSGKSTLVRLLSTLLLHDGGSAHVFGHDVFSEPRAVRGSSTASRSRPASSRRCRRRENLALRRPVLRHGAAGDARRDPGHPGKVGFPIDRRTEPMENLSRGMQQKVALARALLTSPVLLLLDEPTTGLDPRSKMEVQEFIREVRRSHDATILLCTHDLAEAEALADRVGILDRGAAALPRDRAGDPRARSASTRSSRRSSRRPAASSRPRSTRTTRTGRCSHESGGAATLRAELIGLGGVVERNVYLTRRYFWWDVAFMVWTIANTLTIVFIAKGIEATGGEIDVNRATTTAPDRRRRLGLPRDHLRVHHRDGRLGALGGDDRVHVHGAALAGDAPRRRRLLRRALRAGPGDPALRRRRVLLRPRRCRSRTSSPRSSVLVVASLSFFGIGMMTAVLPLISPEKGAQLGFIAQGMLLVVSGVYYPVEVLPQWMQWLSVISPATYALDGHPRRDPRRRRALDDVGRDLAAARHRRGLGSARALGLPARRALREEARQTEAERVVR